MAQQPVNLWDCRGEEIDNLFPTCPRKCQDKLNNNRKKRRRPKHQNLNNNLIDMSSSGECSPVVESAKWAEAGSKELYSQRRRAGRKRAGELERKVKTLHPPKPDDSDLRNVKETEFSTEIRTLQNSYETLDLKETIIDDPHPLPNAGTGSILFDDIDDKQGIGVGVGMHSLSGVIVKGLAESLLSSPLEELSTKTQQQQRPIVELSPQRDLLSPGSASTSSSSTSSRRSPGGGRVIGTVKIADYEGSPRKLVPRSTKDGKLNIIYS